MSLISTAVKYDLYWQTDAGAANTGRVLGDLSYQFALDGTVQSITPTLTEKATVGSWRHYTLNFTTPASTGVLSTLLSTTNGILYPGVVTDRLSRYDADAIAALLRSPVVATLSGGGPVGDTLLRVVKSSYTPISFTVRDATGTAVDLSGYNNPKFAIKSKDQTTTTYSLTSGITMSAGGLVSIPVPEGATFFAALTTGVDSIELYWDFFADEAADSAKSRCLARGKLLLLRTEQ